MSSLAEATGERIDVIAAVFDNPIRIHNVIGLLWNTWIVQSFRCIIANAVKAVDSYKLTNVSVYDVCSLSLIKK